MKIRSYSSFHRMILVLVLAASPVVLVGCGDDLGPTGTVSGKLTYKGQPLPPMHAVVFRDMTRGYTCKGDTDAEGNFTLDSWNNGKLPVGEYAVMVRPPMGEVDVEEIDPDVLMDNPELADGQMQPITYPNKYAAIGSSGLTFEVKEGENDYPLDLED